MGEWMRAQKKLTAVLRSSRVHEPGLRRVIQNLIQKVSLSTFQRSEICRPKITFSIFKGKISQREINACLSKNISLLLKTPVPDKSGFFFLFSFKYFFTTFILHYDFLVLIKLIQFGDINIPLHFLCCTCISRGRKSRI